MFLNPQCDIDQVNEGAAYLLGPTPLVAYGPDDFRTEVSIVSGAQITVSRAPGIFSPLANCLQFETTQTRTSVSLTADNANCEVWSLFNDKTLKALCWGTANAQPLTISFDTQCSLPLTITHSVHDPNNTVSACTTFGYPAGGAAISRASVTFPAMTSGSFGPSSSPYSPGGMKYAINFGFPSGGAYATSTVGSMLSGAFFQVNGTDCLVDQPVGTILRFGNFQADVGSIALRWRPVSLVRSIAMCRQTLIKTHPQGVAINKAAPAGYANAPCLGFYGDPTAAAGQLVAWRFPVPMIIPLASVPVVRTYSAGLPNDPNWFQANGGISSGTANVVSIGAEGVMISNSAVGYPNGSSFFLHAAVSTQLGGNGWL